ncbi:M24 family metallopeptidase [Streptacidiphilus rugosus]|uniref:M24 family metallopeptidase n=1 Tax=Streptacidiphilus rugosus TaxID=405783 RepID=UPI000562C1E5|nr:M24 family metallopeptidase [Streptacidiphilus rugosus]
MGDVFRERRERLRERCSGAGVDAALVTAPANVRWLTGAVGAHALLLGRDRAVVAVEHPARDRDEGLEELLVPPGTDPAVAVAANAGAGVLGVEEHDLTVARHRAVAEVAECELHDLHHAVEQLRVVKDEQEIACLRIAGEIADQALGELLESILVGRSERHLAMELERRMIDHGADGPAFPVRVGAGDHAGRARHLPGDRRVEEGDFLTVSLGACYRGYRASAARTFVVGLAPQEWQIELHGLVFAGQRAAREALVLGGSLDDCARAARRVLEAGGQPELLPEGVGHGVGLDVEEEPRPGALELWPGEFGKIENRVPVTVGLGVTLPGRGGVRIEDTLVVRPSEDGGPELLTITTKELLAL